MTIFDVRNREQGSSLRNYGISPQERISADGDLRTIRLFHGSLGTRHESSRRIPEEAVEQSKEQSARRVASYVYL